MPIEVSNTARPIANSAEQIVDLHAAALNHRDIWMTKGLYPGTLPNIIAGSCGAGMADDRAVIINPNRNWGDNPDYPNQKTYNILGNPHNGTFAETIAVNHDRLHDVPDHLTMEEAAALPLAGLTAFRALFTKARTTSSDKVLISGVGGGVALLACQFAIALGADVYVTSSSDEKIERAIALGAKGGFNYGDEEWPRRFKREIGGVDVVVDSAGGRPFDNLLKVCNPCARIVVYGGTRGMSSMSPQLLFFRELEIYGSTMGNDHEFGFMVGFVNAYKIRPIIDSVFPLDDAAAAYDRMNKGQQFGKIVLKIR